MLTALRPFQIHEQDIRKPAIWSQAGKPESVTSRSGRATLSLVARVRSKAPSMTLMLLLPLLVSPSRPCKHRQKHLPCKCVASPQSWRCPHLQLQEGSKHQALKQQRTIKLQARDCGCRWWSSYCDPVNKSWREITNVSTLKVAS